MYTTKNIRIYICILTLYLTFKQIYTSCGREEAPRNPLEPPGTPWSPHRNPTPNISQIPIILPPCFVLLLEPRLKTDIQAPVIYRRPYMYVGGILCRPILPTKEVQYEDWQVKKIRVPTIHLHKDVLLLRITSHILYSFITVVTVFNSTVKRKHLNSDPKNS